MKAKAGKPPIFRELVWYLKRPYMYRRLLQPVRRRLSRVVRGHDADADAVIQASAWCAERAVDTEAALRTITGKGSSTPVRERFAEVFHQADAAEMNCPVRMGGAGNLNLIYSLAEFTQARAAIETGVAYGWSSLALLLSLQPRNGLLVSTDLSYPGLDNDPYVGCVVPANLRGHWKLLRDADRKAVPAALKLTGPIDLCHYDSDKSYAGRRWTYPRLWEALRPGGLFISDDIGDNLGFCDFARTVSVEPLVTRSTDKFVGILVKPRERLG